MKITLRINSPELHKKIKLLAVQRGESMETIIEEALREYLKNGKRN